MIFKKSFALILSVILIFTALSGCNKSKEAYILYMEFDSAPKTLDPQLASSIAEETVVKSLFEGLIRLDENGKPVPAAAESFTVSNDELTYTFKLRGGMKWSNDDDVTAKDFVFGIERAALKKTKSPYVSSLYSVVGVEEISKGKIGTLGVKAVDEKTVEIKLKEKNPDFLKVLTTAPCMPCNKKAFEKAKGKYCLEKKYTVTNGSYYLKSWVNDGDFSLRVNKNSDYNGKFVSQANAVIFSVGEKSERAEKIKESNLDLGFIDYTEDESVASTFSKTCYALLINKNSDIGKSAFRKAIEGSIHRNAFKNELPAGMCETNILLPDVIQKNGVMLNSKGRLYSAEYNPTEAHNLYLSAVKQFGNPGEVNVLAVDDACSVAVATLTAEGLQQALGVFANVEKVESVADLNEKISVGDYKLAVVPVTAANFDAKDYLSLFCSDNPNNIYGISVDEFDSTVKNMNVYDDENATAAKAFYALERLAEDKSFIALAKSYEAFGVAEGYKIPKISPFGGVMDFSLIVKE